MIKSYFKAAWRNLILNKGYSVLNILGLATVWQEIINCISMAPSPVTIF